MMELTQLPTTAQICRQEVDLALPSTDNAVRLREFMCRARETLGVRMLRMTGSWRGSLITYELQKPVTTENMLDELAKIPGVEKAEEIGTKKQDIPRRRIEVILSAGLTTDDHTAVMSIPSNAAISVMNVNADS